MATNGRAITVFGSARIKAASRDYVAAQRIGQLLAEHGFSVVTGGYNGAMEAVSRGAKEGGGQTIGVTVNLLAEGQAPNEWVDQEVKTAALLQRVDTLVEMGSGYVALPGGAGTLVELAAVWNLAQLGALHGKPIVVLGEGWRTTLHGMLDRLHIDERDLALLTFVDTPEEAVEALERRLAAAASTRSPADG
jgi:uncharacterized protein (TIGR00730 family)